MRFQKFLLIFLMAGLNLKASAQSNEQPTDAKSREFFRGKSKVNAAAPTIAQAASANSSDDALLELLRQKQTELDSQEKIAPAKTAPAPEIQKPVVNPVPARPVAAPSNVSSSSTETDLLEILRQKQAELDAQTGRPRVPAAAQTVQPSPKAPERKPEPKPAVVAAPKAEPVGQPAVSPETEEKLLKLLQSKQAELDAKEKGAVAAQKPAPAVTPSESDKTEKRIRQIEAEIKAKEEAFKKSAAKPKAPVTKESRVVSPAKPSTAPAAPIVAPGSKEARLGELLRKYKADEITPHEYHTERAKIIAEP